LGHQQLEFVFTNSSDVVVNRSQASTRLNGQLSAPNGTVVILSPNKRLQVGSASEINAGSFIATSRLDADASQFLNKEDTLTFTANGQSSRVSAIDGSITTTDGSIILASNGDLTLNASMQSGNDMIAVTGNEISIGNTIEAKGNGQIIQNSSFQANRDISLVAQRNVTLSGQQVLTANQGEGKVFVRVDDGRSINVRGGTLIVRGEKVFSTPETGEALSLKPNEGGTPGALSPAVNEFPTRSRNRKTTVLRPTSAPVTSLAGKVFNTGKKTSRKSTRLAKNSAVPSLPLPGHGFHLSKEQKSCFGKKSKKVKSSPYPSE